MTMGKIDLASCLAQFGGHIGSSITEAEYHNSFASQLFRTVLHTDQVSDCDRQELDWRVSVTYRLNETE